METFQIECGGIVAEINCSYPENRKRCEEFIVSGKKADFEINLTEEDIAFAAAHTHFCPEAYVEFIALYCVFANKVINHGGIMFHASGVELEGEGFAFAARSGVGKTTHTRLWQECFGKRCKVVNGDKPLITFKNKTAYICGTPWKGKEGYGSNLTVPLKGICFIERGEENTIRRLSHNQVIDRLFYQLSLPKAGAANMVQGLELADKLLKSTDFFAATCNMTVNAAETVYNGMKR